MTTKITIPVFAAIAAIAIAFGTMSFSPEKVNDTEKKIAKAPVFANYYYQFTGSPGQEDDESLWQLISESDYLESTCNKNKNGCVIKTISSAGSAPSHPALVPVSGSGSSMTPVVDGTNIAAAKFKNP